MGAGLKSVGAVAICPRPKLAEAREALGLKREELAMMLGRSVTAVANAESGRMLGSSTATRMFIESLCQTLKAIAADKKIEVDCRTHILAPDICSGVKR